MTSLPVLNQLPDPRAARPRPPFLATAAPVDFGEGFFAEEIEDLEPYRWMGLRGRLEFAPAAGERYLEFWALSEFRDLTQQLLVRMGDSLASYSLAHGWTRMSLPVAEGVTGCGLEVECPFPHAYYDAGDTRDLTIRVRSPYLHADRTRHDHVSGQYLNTVRNTREMLAGAAELRSTPKMLGIDMYGGCNVKPPCVYCEWDEHKELEGVHVDEPFTLQTLEDYGEFFGNAGKVVNCSIGEPFMMKDLDRLLDVFGDTGKLLELTTNGQILTEKNIERLLGRNVGLYISLDAATPETYAKLRNDRFEQILVNLRRLVAAKGGTRGLPRIFLVFMPMKVNLHELEGFVELCAELGVDRMILRPLNYSDTIDLDWERNGHRFRYQDELLPFDQVVKASVDAARWSRRYGVELADQMDFGGAMREAFAEAFAAAEEEAGEASTQEGASAAVAGDEPDETAVGAPGSAAPVSSAAPAVVVEAAPEAAEVAAGSLDEPFPSLGGERLPACREPWNSLYILRRGVYPCCYGKEPLAEMGGYREAWNSPLMQAIRRDLAAGRFHDYCLTSTACPMIRKSDAMHELPLRQAALLRARHAWHVADRRLGGVPGRVYRAAKWLGIRAARAATDPAYVRHHARRLIHRAAGRV